MVLRFFQFSSRRLSIKGCCYERDNGYKTHRAKRSCLFQAHYKNDDNLEGIRKRKQEAIWQSTFSFLSPYSTGMDVSSFPSLVQAELWFESYNVTSSLLHKDFNSRLAERGKTVFLKLLALSSIR